jgi:hypothetical protein
MTDIMKDLEVLDENDECTLYHLENEIFDTAVLVYNEGMDDEQVLVLTDMQGAYPESIEEVPEYDWVNAEEVDF